MERLEAKQTAVLFFDFLNHYVKSKDGTVRESYQFVVANAVKLMEKAREKEMIIAFAAANHRSDNATSGHIITDVDMHFNQITQGGNTRYNPGVHGGTWEAQVIDELKQSPDDYFIPKYRWSAFYQTYLDLALRSRGINTIIISGGATEVGVASTAFAARDMDYNLVIASDACISSAQDNHDQLMNRIFPRMSRVRTTEQIVSLLAGTSS